MRTLLPFLLAVFYSLFGIAQNWNASHYDSLKLAGAIPLLSQQENVQSWFTPSSQTVPLIHPSTPSRSLAGCNCYIPPDTTYTQAMLPNDDGSSALLQLPFNFCFYGDTISDFYINNNGNISFGAPYFTFTASGFPSNSFTMVAPFWGDVDTQGSQSGQVWYKITPSALYVVWEEVGYFPSADDKLNTFSLIITDGNDPVIGVGNNVAFCYEDMQWTTGAASGGQNGFGGTPATVGANQGNGTDYIQFGRFDQPGTGYDGPFGANDSVDFLDYKSYTFNTCNATNISPIAVGLDLCDTLRLCVGDSLPIDLAFLAPEINQTTFVSYDTANATSFVVNNSDTGNTAIFEGLFVAADSTIGLNVLSINAWDNGSPSDTVTFNLIIQVDSANFKPEILTSGVTVCPNDSVVLAADTSYESYSWVSVPSSDSSVVVGAGNYVLRATRDGCSVNSDTTTIIGAPFPTPVIEGDLHYCFDDGTTLSVDSLYTNVSWSNGVMDYVTVEDTGVVVVIVTDSNGCIGSDSVMITQSSPGVSISGNIPYCEGELIQLTAAGGGLSIVWSTGDTANTVIVGTGTHTASVMDTNGCEARDSIVLAPLVVPNVAMVINPTSPGGVREVISFVGETQVIADSIASWYWDLGNGTTDSTQQASASYALPGNYTITLIVESSDGCFDTIQVAYEIVSLIAAPNVFTPNGDGINDFLIFEGLNFYPENSLSVYNRWGISLFTASPYRNNWDAHGLSEGTYYYVLEIPEFGAPLKGTIQILD